MDKKAKNILFTHFWKNGWIDAQQRMTAEDSFQYAKSKGLMFDPFSISHDECVNEILKMAEAIASEKAVKAFLSSLSSRRLDWRSGLASYFMAQQLIQHRYMPAASGQSYDESGSAMHQSFSCGICRDLKYGMRGNKCYENEDLNVLNFERIKWGGVRHGDLLYAYFDLKQFVSAEIPEPTDEDLSIFRDILKIIEQSEPADCPGALEKKLKAAVKSSKDERKMLIEILACIELLKPQSFDRPRRGANDWVFAACWRGEDKYNQSVVDKLFGQYFRELSK